MKLSKYKGNREEQFIHICPGVYFLYENNLYHKINNNPKGFNCKLLDDTQTIDSRREHTDIVIPITIKEIIYAST